MKPDSNRKIQGGGELIMSNCFRVDTYLDIV